MDGFKSPIEAANFLGVWLVREIRMAKQDWLETVVNYQRKGRVANVSN